MIGWFVVGIPISDDWHLETGTKCSDLQKYKQIVIKILSRHNVIEDLNKCKGCYFTVKGSNIRPLSRTNE